MRQLSILGHDPVAVRPVPVARHPLDATSWVDHAPGWLAGADALLDDLLDTVTFRQGTRRLFDADRIEPRLSGEVRRPDEHPALLPLAAALTARYGRRFDTAFLNLYRTGADSVAWHRDRIHRHQRRPLVAIISLGATRTFRLRPHGGGTSTGFAMASGDLLVMGGECQHRWEHAVPKTKRPVGVRMSVTLRPSADDHPAAG